MWEEVIIEMLLNLKKNGKIHNFKVKIFNILKYGVFLSPATTPGPTSAGLSDPIENPVRQVSSLQSLILIGEKIKCT